jgi:hypothetical protein
MFSTSIMRNPKWNGWSMSSSPALALLYWMIQTEKDMGRSDDHSRSFKEFCRRQPHAFPVMAVILEPTGHTFGAHRLHPNDSRITFLDPHKSKLQGMIELSPHSPLTSNFVGRQGSAFWLYVTTLQSKNHNGLFWSEFSRTSSQQPNSRFVDDLKLSGSNRLILSYSSSPLVRCQSQIRTHQALHLLM